MKKYTRDNLLDAYHNMDKKNKDLTLATYEELFANNYGVNRNVEYYRSLILEIYNGNLDPRTPYIVDVSDLSSGVMFPYDLKARVVNALQRGGKYKILIKKMNDCEKDKNEDELVRLACQYVSVCM